MSTMRLALAGTVLAALAVPLVGTPAGATTPTLTRASVAYVADLDGDFFYGLYVASAAAPATRTTLIADTGTVDVAKARVSPDGTKVAALVDRVGAGDYQLEIINVADGSHSVAVSVPAHTQTTDTEIFGFDWSKDGASIVYSLFQASGGTSSLALKSHTVDQSTPTADTTVPNGTNLADPSFSPDGTKLAAVLTTTSQLVVVDGSGVTVIGTPATDVGFTGTTWSPDGTHVATSAGPDSATQHADIDLFSVSGAADQTPVVVSSGGTHLVNEEPQFAADGSLWFDRWDGALDASGIGDLMRAQVGTAGTWVVTDRTNTPTVDEAAPAFATPIDDAAPSAVTFTPFGLAGTSVVLHWTSPDDDYSHITLSRSVDGGGFAPLATNVTGTAYVDKGLTVGHTYSYVADATFDGAGHQSGAASGVRNAMALNAPKIVVANPTAKSWAKLPFRVTWGVTNPAGTTYSVTYANRVSGTWAVGAPHAWIASTTAGYGTFTTGVAGQTYYFQATVHDTYGNTGVTGLAQANVPYDQTAGAFGSGWSTLSSSSYWLGSLRSTAVNGAYVTFAPTSKSVSIIGDKCPACGSLKVYVDGHLKPTVSTKASTTLHRQVLWTFSNPSIAKHTFKIVAVLAKGQVLRIDGLADPR